MLIPVITWIRIIWAAYVQFIICVKNFNDMSCNMQLSTAWWIKLINC